MKSGTLPATEQHADDEQLAYALPEVARMLSVSVSFLRLESRRGRLLLTRLGRRIIIRREEIARYLAAGDSASTDERSPVWKADRATIRRALSLMIDAGTVHGFVALKLKGQRGEAQDGGYFDSEHLDALINQAVNYSGKAESVCITLNPCKPALLARRANRVDRLGKGESTGKDAIVRRRLFFIDIDAFARSDRRDQCNRCRTRGCV